MEKDVVIGGKLDLDLLRVIIGVEALAAAQGADVDLFLRGGDGASVLDLNDHVGLGLRLIETSA